MDSKQLAPAVLRISLALVFLYFSINQLSNPANWVSFVPSSFILFGATAKGIVIFNGFLELVLGTFLLIGLYTRVAALILSLHLFGIAFSIGFIPLGVRDFGLAFATLALFLSGYDKYTLDYKFAKKSN